MNEFAIIKPSDWQKKLFYMKIRYFMKSITENYSQYVDKISAKTIVNNMCKNDILEGKLHIAKIIRELSSHDDIYDTDINVDHIIKSAHASRWNINIKTTTDINYVKMKLRQYNKKYKPFDELQYSYLKPKFFIEEKIDDKYFGKNGNALSYGFYCVHSKIQFIVVDSQNPEHKYDNIYDADWHLVGKNLMSMNIEKPKTYDDIIRIVKILSAPFEFVRIDIFLAKNDVIYFSEFTFTPNAGAEHMKNFDDLFTDEWV